LNMGADGGLVRGAGLLSIAIAHIGRRPSRHL